MPGSAEPDRRLDDEAGAGQPAARGSFAGTRRGRTRPPEERVATNVLVIGAGAAGLRAAIELTERGVHVLCTASARAATRIPSWHRAASTPRWGRWIPEDTWQAACRRHAQGGLLAQRARAVETART